MLRSVDLKLGIFQWILKIIFLSFKAGVDQGIPAFFDVL